MWITSAFDGGNIRVLDSKNPADIQLEIVPDTGTSYYQWFYFRLVGGKELPCRMRILNAAGAHAGTWENYQAVISYDRKTWHRVETVYENGILEITHTPKTNSVYVAYFAPYSLERHMDTVARAINSGIADLKFIGTTLDGLNIDLLTVGAPSADKLTFWITARQHPGETMGSGRTEGFLDRLLDENCVQASILRDKVAFFIVPNMNPDGSWRGHLRTNAAGVDLNRAWKAPSLKTSPEVFRVRELMFATRPDMSLEVHGTEGMSHAFIVGPEGPAGSKEPVSTLLTLFKSALLAANPDFQTEVGFDTPPDRVVDALGTNYQGEILGSLCMTLEMPFKDTTHTPDAQFGFSPKRARQMGYDCVDAMASILPKLEEARHV